MKRKYNQLFNWEQWSFKMIYAPLTLVWLFYMVRARAFWFFSNVNPTLLFSGFEGENKREMYEQLPADLYPLTVYLSPGDCAECALCKITSHGLGFPFIAKPDVGTQGLMFRKIETEQEFFRYHETVGGDYLVQPFIDLPEEYSLFYIRYPGETKGKITGLIKKDYLAVTGDGVSSLARLIQTDSRASSRWEEMKQKHQAFLNDIIPADEKYILSIAGNHNRGAKFINLQHEIDEPLCAVFDEIGNHVPQFYYGRYDLKCTSLADLKKGKNIQILEFNGTGAEPNHIYDCGMKYFDALKVIVQHWEDLYRISRINYDRGIPYWKFRKGRQHLRKTMQWYDHLRKTDLSFHL